MSEQEPSMRVTLRDVYDAVNELKDVVSELAASQREQGVREQASEQVHQDHEQRLRAVERKVWSLPSLAAVIGVISVALSLLQWVQR